MRAQEAFAELAHAVMNRTVAAGRHAFQADAEARIIPDIAEKLRLEPDHALLEIGCGTGNLLIPLAGLVTEVVGLDHAGCIDRLRRESLPANVSLLAGTWPGTHVERTFDRVLAYSVLHYLPSIEAATGFVDGCVSALAPGGWLLLGDLPNRSKLVRFRATQTGREFERRWRTLVEQDGEEDAARDRIFGRVAPGGEFIDDAFVAALLTRWRDSEHEAYVLPQPENLPFAFTREDVLIRRLPQ